MNGGEKTLQLHNPLSEKKQTLNNKSKTFLCHFPLLSFELSYYKSYLNYKKVKHLENKMNNKIEIRRYREQTDY